MRVGFRATKNQHNGLAGGWVPDQSLCALREHAYGQVGCRFFRGCRTEDSSHDRAIGSAGATRALWLDLRGGRLGGSTLTM
jgi:hypothetical protein